MEISKLPPDGYFEEKWVALESKAFPERRSHIRRNALVAALALTLVGGTGIAAYAVQRSMTAGERVDALDSWIDEFHDVAAGPLVPDDEGWPAQYGDLKLSSDEGLLQVYWVGTPTAAVSEFLDRPTNGFRVELVPADYGIAELESAGAKILKADNENRLIDGASIVATRPAPGRLGLIVEFVTDGEPLDGAAVEKLRAAAEKISEVAVLNAVEGEELSPL